MDEDDRADEEYTAPKATAKDEQADGATGGNGDGKKKDKGTVYKVLDAVAKDDQRGGRRKRH